MTTFQLNWCNTEDVFSASLLTTMLLHWPLSIFLISALERIQKEYTPNRLRLPVKFGGDLGVYLVRRVVRFQVSVCSSNQVVLSPNTYLHAVSETMKWGKFDIRNGLFIASPRILVTAVHAFFCCLLCRQARFLSATRMRAHTYS